MTLEKFQGLRSIELSLLAMWLGIYKLGQLFGPFGFKWVDKLKFIGCLWFSFQNLHNWVCDNFLQNMKDTLAPFSSKFISLKGRAVILNTQTNGSISL